VLKNDKGVAIHSELIYRNPSIPIAPTIALPKYHENPTRSRVLSGDKSLQQEKNEQHQPKHTRRGLEAG